MMYNPGTTRKMLLPFLLVNLLVRSALGMDEGPFVLHLQPVYFDGKRNADLKNATGAYLELASDQNNFAFGDRPQKCNLPLYPEGWGRVGTLDISDDMSLPWQIRISSPKAGCRLVMTPTDGDERMTMEIVTRFGDEATCLENEYLEMVVSESPKGYDRPTERVTVADSDKCKPFLETAILFEINSTKGCPKVDQGVNDIVINVSEPLPQREYLFEPCYTHMALKGVENIYFNCTNHTRRSLEEGDATLEDGECPYCEPGACPCCPLPDDPTESPTESPVRNPSPATTPSGTKQKASSVAIAGVTLGAIATALGLLNLGILLSRRQASS